MSSFDRQIWIELVREPAQLECLQALALSQFDHGHGRASGSTVARLELIEASSVNSLAEQLLLRGVPRDDIDRGDVFSAMLLARCPSAQRVYQYRGTLMKQLGRFADAAHRFKRASQLDPKDASSAYSLAECLWHTDRLEEFADVAKRIFILEPSFAELCQNVGNVFFELGRKRDALEFYSRALKLSRTGSQTFLGLANCLAAFDQFEEASVAFSKGLLLDPQLPSCY